MSSLCSVDEGTSRPTSEQGAGLWGSEGIIAGGHPYQEGVLGGILLTEVPQLSSGLGHLRSQTHGDGNNNNNKSVTVVMLGDSRCSNVSRLHTRT